MTLFLFNCDNPNCGLGELNFDQFWISSLSVSYIHTPFISKVLISQTKTSGSLDFLESQLNLPFFKEQQLLVQWNPAIKTT